ncbi:hypothetical protein Tco_1581455 [Tanacetum coccineum]
MWLMKRLVEVEMEEEVCSDLVDDMEDPVEDGECDREGGVADQSFPETVGNMTADKNSSVQSQTEERGTQLGQCIEILFKHGKFENINSLIKNKC